ncbi:TOM1-like protein 2 [Xenoophorus captivus]|uniref:TOM1-like protein 2 n=1 Tax=Xenoophorus captivus TaxID=1517983 RepID=A0ABV0QMX1_9TELE
MFIIVIGNLSALLIFTLSFVYLLHSTIPWFVSFHPIEFIGGRGLVAQPPLSSVSFPKRVIYCQNGVSTGKSVQHACGPVYRYVKPAACIPGQISMLLHPVGLWPSDSDPYLAGDGQAIILPGPKDVRGEMPVRPKDAMRALKKRLSGNRNYREVMLALTVLETCVKNCGHRFHVHVANRDFIDGVMVKIISPKANPPTIVQDKVLSSPDLTGVVHIYEELKRKGVEFPMADLDALSPIHTPQRGTPEVDPAMMKYLAPNTSSAGAPKPSQPTPAATQAANIPSPVTATPEQIARLRSELDIVRGNIKVMSEMLTELVPGKEDGSDLELLQVRFEPSHLICYFKLYSFVLCPFLPCINLSLCPSVQELNRTCRAMQQRVVELISRVSNEEVTEELLHVNDDLNNIFLRYERCIQSKPISLGQ